MGAVEGGVVDDDFGTLHIIQNFLNHGSKFGFVAQEFVADAMNLEGIFVAIAAGVEIEMQVVASELAVDQFNTTQLDNAVATLSREARGFGV